MSYIRTMQEEGLYSECPTVPPFLVGFIPGSFLVLGMFRVNAGTHCLAHNHPACYSIPRDVTDTHEKLMEIFTIFPRFGAFPSFRMARTPTTTPSMSPFWRTTTRSFWRDEHPATGEANLSEREILLR